MQSSMLWPSLSRGCHPCAGWGGGDRTRTLTNLHPVRRRLRHWCVYLYIMVLLGVVNLRRKVDCSSAFLLTFSMCTGVIFDVVRRAFVQMYVCESISSDTISKYHDISDLDLDR